MKVGESVSTQKGHGIVSCLSDEMITILLDDGQQVFIPVAKPVKVRPMRKRHIGPRATALLTLREEDLTVFSSPFAMGFLASAATFSVDATVGWKGAFIDDYAAATGGVSWESSCYNEFDSKWGVECRISFIASEGLVKRLGLYEYVICGRAGNYRINNNALWWELIARGFRLGNKHNIENIAAPMSEEDKVLFNQGINSAIAA